jgi:tetraacyldisaccharide 4'-kinase
MRLAQAVEAAWAADSPGRRLLVGLLGPAAAAYGAAVRLRNTLYDRGLLSTERVAATVLSVGNLTVGGSGKTPTVLWLAQVLAHRGRRVGVIARGYRKRRRGVVVVGAHGHALVAPEEGGDEAVLLAMRLGMPVVTGERRAAAARLACARFGCDTLVLDDGFQHRALGRDADLVVVSASGLPARLLPAGPLREPARALARARAVLVLGDDEGTAPSTLGPGIPDAAVPTSAVFQGRVVPSATVRLVGGALVAEDLDRLPRDRVVAVAGVARPERFWRLLERLGVQPAARLAFPDHHPYGAADGARIVAATAGTRSVITTEKDLVKLARLPQADAMRLHGVRIGVAVADGERLVDLLLGDLRVRA